MNHKLLLLFLLVCLLPMGCGVIPTTIVKTQYVDTRKTTEDTTIAMPVPKIGLPAAMQAKGGVSVSCELIPFSTERTEQEDRNVTYSDPNAPGYDVFEVVKKPVYVVKPDEFQFKIRIKNNQDRVLKLKEVPIILIVGATQTAIPKDVEAAWQAGLIPKGFEKEFMVRGPKLSSLSIPNTIYIAVDDVPILYDDAGNVTKKDNFEWIFQIKEEEFRKQDKIVYAYEKEPIYKKQCEACGGKGYTTTIEQCYWCKGSGIYTDKEGNRRECSHCKGTARIQVQRKCEPCSGRGVFEYPKSSNPPIAKETKWIGWKVKVDSNPPGAKISMFDANTEQYKDVGYTSKPSRWTEIPWVQTLSKDCPVTVKYQGEEIKVLTDPWDGNKYYPIIVEYQGKKVKVLPCTQDGKKGLEKVMIDFASGAETQVTVGKKVE